MSVIFEAFAKKKEHNILEVLVYIVHPQQFEFYESKGFALLLLWDAINPFLRDKIALTKVISLHQVDDSAWVANNVNEFIKEITLLKTCNYPIRYEWNEMPEEEQQDFF